MKQNTRKYRVWFNLPYTRDDLFWETGLEAEAKLFAKLVGSVLVEECFTVETIEHTSKDRPDLLPKKKTRKD